MFTAITPEYGTLHFLGKGFREKHKWFLAPFEPINLLEVVFYERSRSGLQLLKEADTVESFSGIRTDIRAYAYACYFAEIVGHMAVGAHHDATIFGLLIETLREIGKTDLDRLAETFQVKLLRLAGFLPQLYTCVNCDARDLDGCFFDYEQGGVLCGACALLTGRRLRMSAGTLKTLRYLARSPFRRGLALKTGRETQAELKGILRRFISYRMESELRTLGVLDELKRRAPAVSIGQTE